MKKASKMSSGPLLRAFPIPNQLQIEDITPAPSPRQRFWLNFRYQNSIKIYKKINLILYQILDLIFHRFWMNFDLFFNPFFIKMTTNIKKGDFVKMSVSPTRNTHFHDFGTWFCNRKSIKKRKKKRERIWYTFLTDFPRFWPSFWSQKALKNVVKI